MILYYFTLYYIILHYSMSTRRPAGEDVQGARLQLRGGLLDSRGRGEGADDPGGSKL